MGNVSRLIRLIVLLTLTPLHRLAADEQTSPRGGPEQISLRVETGAHLQRIENMFLGTSHTRIVTVSTEGTIRIWDSQTGAPVRIFWLPMPADSEVQKSGMSRTGKYLGIGMWLTGRPYLIMYQVNGPPAVHLMPDQISGVAFAADEKSVAIAMQKTMTVYSLPDFRPVFEDKFSDVVWAVDFDSEGRLAVGSFAGEVRLYDADHHLITQTKAKASRQITDLRFSPSGNRIALGFNFSAGDEILRMPDLSSVSTLIPVAGAAHEVARVAWEQDGKLLTSMSEPGAKAGERPGYSIFEWTLDDDGQPAGPPSRLQNATGSLMTLADVPLPTGDSFAVGLWNGDVYRADRSGQIWRAGGTKIYFDEETPSTFVVSDNGGAVGLDTATKGRAFRLDLLSGDLSAGRGTDSLHPPPRSSPNVVVTGEGEHNALLINGKAPPLDRWESVSAWTVDPEGNVYLATRFNLRRFSPSAEAIWTASPGPEVWAVNVTTDGRYVITTLGDGTIRWFDRRSGDQVLSVFIQSDLSRWVAWRPDGHFTGSADAAALLRVFRTAPASLRMSPIDPASARREFQDLDLITHLLAPAK
jgi:WD40 repeat protein